MVRGVPNIKACGGFNEETDISTDPYIEELRKPRHTDHVQKYIEEEPRTMHHDPWSKKIAINMLIVIGKETKKPKKRTINHGPWCLDHDRRLNKKRGALAPLNFS